MSRQATASSANRAVLGLVGRVWSPVLLGLCVVRCTTLLLVVCYDAIRQTNGDVLATMA